MQRNLTPAENQLRVMNLANNLRFPDDYDEYVERADSGGSTYGMLKRRAFAQSSLRVRPSAALAKADVPRLRSKSLVPPSKQVIDSEKCIIAALCQQTERRASIMLERVRASGAGGGGLGATTTLQVVQPPDYRRHSSSAACRTGREMTPGVVMPADLKKRGSYAYVDPSGFVPFPLFDDDSRRAVGRGVGPVPICRRRSFSVTPRGSLVNQGDEMLIVPSMAFETDLTLVVRRPSEGGAAGEAGGSRSNSNNSGDGSGGASGRSSVDTSVYRVLMLGGPGVGKTALTQQFITSEFMAAQNTSFGKT